MSLSAGSLFKVLILLSFWGSSVYAITDGVHMRLQTCARRLDKVKPEAREIRDLSTYSPAITEKIRALAEKHRVLFNNPNFRALVEEHMLIENVEIQTPEEKWALSKNVWASIVTKYKALAPSVWSLPHNPKDDLGKAAKEYGYTYPALRDAALAIKEVDDSPELREATLNYMAEGFGLYAVRGLIEKKYDPNSTYGRGFFRLWRRVLGNFVAIASAAYVAFPSSGHGSLIGGGAVLLGAVGLNILDVFIIEGRNKFKIRKNEEELVLLTSGEGKKSLPPAQGAVPVLSQEANPIEIEAEITRLENINPILNTNSISSIENFGAELEDAVKIAAYEISVIHERAAESSSISNLKKVLDQILNQKNLTWKPVASQLRDPLSQFQNHIRYEASEFERTYLSVTRLKDLFDPLINRLQSERDVLKRSATDPIDKGFANRLSELRALQNTLSQMANLLATEFDVLSKTRQKITTFNNDMSLRISNSRGNPLSEDDLQTLHQIHSMVTVLTQGEV